MKLGRYGTLVLSSLMLMGGQAVMAQEAPQPEGDQSAEVRAAYERALAEAEREREAALEAVERTRAEMERAASEAEHAQVDSEAAREQARRQERLEREERQKMRQELSRAQEELRQASREVVRVHRELDRSQRETALAEVYSSGNRAVIGVILGDSDETGVKVLGVSPDGPAERAGIRQGDTIVAVMGEPLASKDGAPASKVLLEVMKDVKPGDELEIAVQRGDGDTELTLGVTAEQREPVGWASMIRLPSAPDAPDAPVIIERIEVPHIDKQALKEKMEQLEKELAQREILIHQRGKSLAPEVWEFELDKLSELGEEALYSANVWFGMPMTRGLKLAEINEQLGEYFKTDHGVLVLKAEEDNDLQLESGDVVVAVGGNRVERPADLMRELREVEPGLEIEIEIMRKRKSRTLDVVVPEQQFSFKFAPEAEHEHEYQYRVEIKPD
jgi:C-terminal processing protease CtpA/Prc